MWTYDDTGQTFYEYTVGLVLDNCHGQSKLEVGRTRHVDSHMRFKFRHNDHFIQKEM